MIPRKVVIYFVGAAMISPIAISVVVGVAQLLKAMGDVEGAQMLMRFSTVLGILWAVDLICLSILLGMDLLLRNEKQDDG